MTRTQSREPIAIVGIACRFPGGASSPSKLWDLVCEKRDVQQTIPPDRFNIEAFYDADGERAGCTNAAKAYLLREDVRRFDASFFRVSPAEAEAMDPQQRLLLETVYEATEDAGAPCEGLRGSDTAVFVGSMTGDYHEMLLRDVEAMPKYMATGTARSMLSNRVSYAFDWRGPSMTIDTACSSSLVAVHEAVTALRAGVSTLACAAGANLILGPEMMISESKLHMLSPTGRSRMWDAAADGYARGEGTAAVLLKTLSRALRDGDRIHGLVRETGVNSDGRTSGITLPSSDAQKALIRQTYARAGLDWSSDAGRCQFFEAHGTGTPAGDPLEATAIHDAFFGDGAQCPGAGLLVGSVKTVIGHLEGCAGLAGLIKAVEAVRRGVVPPNMLLETLNPAVERFAGRLRVPTEVGPWPALAPGTPRRASVNSFGFGGTNCHAIVESFEMEDEAPEEEEEDDGLVAMPLVVSANSEASLRRLQARLCETLEATHDTARVKTMLRTLATRRSQLPLRAFFSGSTTEALRTKLRSALAADDALPVAFVEDARPPGTPGRVVGVFTGQGAQWPSMGRALLQTPPGRELMARLEAALASLPEPPSWRLSEQCETGSRIAEAAVAQPLCTAVQLLVVELLRRAGLRFDAVVGHSSGEMAAAYAAGFLGADDAIRIAYYRGVCASLARGPDGRSGAMMAAGLSHDEAAAFCDEAFAGRLAVAAVNAPASVTLSGDADAVDDALALIQARGVFARRLRVDTAYHSFHMEPCAAPYLALLEACRIRCLPGDPACQWFSSVSGERVDASRHGRLLEGEYWRDNMVQPVLFARAVELVAGSCHVAVEVGPHPALKGPFNQTYKQAVGVQLPYHGTLSRGVDDVEAMGDALGFLFSSLGRDAVDLAAYADALSPSSTVCRLPASGLPSYPWDHSQSFWKTSRRSDNFLGRSRPPHPLLGVRSAEAAARDYRWLNRLRLSDSPWLQGHRVEKNVIYPAAGYLVMAMEAAKALDEAREVRCVELLDVSISSAIQLDAESPAVETLFTLSLDERGDDSAAAAWACYSSAAGSSWKCNARGRLRASFGPPGVDEDALPPRSPPSSPLSKVNMDRFYSSLSGIGLDYTGAFKHLDGVSRRAGLATATATQMTAPFSAMIHPALLDSAFQALFAAYCWPDDGSLRVPFVPTSLRSLVLVNMDRVPDGEPLVIDACLTDGSARELTADISMYTAAGKPLFQLQGMACTALRRLGPQDYKELYTRTAWELCVGSGVASSGVRQHDEPQDLELVDLCERLSLFYLRDLNSKIDRRQVPAMEWHFRCIFEWLDHLLPLVEAGEHPTIRREWAADQRSWLLEQAARFPGQIDLLLIQAVGENLAAVVRGETSMLEHMIEGDLLNRFYKHGLGFQRANGHVSAIAKQMAHANPRMKILEIGAGTGGATKGVLEALGSAFDEYVFTDISTGFFEAAADAFAPWAARMLFKRLNVENDAAAQGFAEASFDLVVASNVLHATKSLAHTMRNVRRLLRPGGRLLLLEVTSDIVRVKLMMAGLPGWWLGRDDGRRHGPTIPVSEWNSLLLSTGFSGVDHDVKDFVDESRHMTTVMLTQAVDDTVAVLRQPLSCRGDWLSGRAVTVVGGRRLNFANRVADALLGIKEVPQSFSVHRVDALDALPSELPPMRCVVILQDVDEPVLKTLTPRRLAALKRTINEARQVLWVSRGCRKQEPYANMSIGLCRSLAAEYSHLRIQHVDMEELDLGNPLAVSRIAEAAARLLFEATLKQSASAVSWPLEPELVLERGDWLIPRVLPDVGLNDQLNAGKMAIQTRSSLATEAVEVRRSSPRGNFVMAQAPPSLPSATSRDGVWIRVTCASLYPLRADGGGPVYLCLGHKEDDPQRQLLAVTSVCGSRALVHQSCLFECFGATAAYLSELALGVVASQLLQGVKSTVVLHEGDGFLGEAIRNKAAELGLKCVSTTFAGSASKPLDAGRDVVSIHRRAAERDVKSLLGGASLLVDFSERDTAEEQSLLRRCAPRQCGVVRVCDLFGGEASASPESPGLVFLKRVKAAMEAFPGLNASSEAKVIKATDMSGLKPSDTHYASVVDFTPDEVSATLQPLNSRLLFRSDKTYFMVGCTGGLGQALCRWMVSLGVRYLALTTRSVLRVDAAWLAELRLKAHVVVFEVDVGNKAALAAVHDRVVREMPPVCGAAQAAMVLADRSFNELRADDFDAVFGPKVRATQNLHELFQDQPLDFFVMFSSLASVVGNRGQANYAAANLFMSAVAAQRRARGLAASVVHIGMVLGVGYVSANGEHEETLRQYNYMPISEADFLDMFSQAVIVGRPASGHGPELITGLNRCSRQPDGQRFFWFENPRFSHHTLDEQREELATASKTSLAQRLADTNGSPEALVEVVQHEFCTKLERMLQAQSGSIRVSQSLMDLGVDSLIAAEVRSWFLKELDVDLPVLKLLDTASIAHLCREAASQLCSAPPPPVVEVDAGASINVELNVVPCATDSSVQIQGESAAEISDSSTTATLSSHTMTSLLDRIEDTSACTSFDNHEKPSSTANPPKPERTGRLSYAQERLWFLQQLLRDDTTYNVTLLYRLTGPLRLTDLEAAFNTVIQRHETLRTCFFTDPQTGLPTQAVYQHGPFSLQKKQYTTSSAHDDFAQLQGTRYDLERGPVIKAIVGSSPGNDYHTLVLGFHHIALDGFSAQVLMRDLALAYSGMQLPRAPRNYLKYAEEERDLAVPNETLDYWKSQFATMPPTSPTFPFAECKARMPLKDYKTRSLDRTLPPALSSSIKSAARRLGVTPFHVHLGALQALLFSLTSASDICIGIVDANKSDAAYAETVGFFVNVLPLRFQADASHTLADMVREAKAKANGALTHRMPFDLLLDELNVSRTTTHSPLFQAMLNFKMGSTKTASLGECQAELLGFKDASNPYDLVFDIESYQDGSVSISIKTQQYLYTEMELDIVLDTFTRALSLLAENPLQKASACVTPSPEEKEAALKLGRGVRIPLPAFGKLSRYLDHWAARQPAAVAVKDDNVSLSYSELKSRVDSLAAALQQAGIGSRARVCMYCEPSVHTLCCLLAINKAGVAYVPLDVANPVNRLQAMVDDCEPDVLLFDDTTSGLVHQFQTSARLIKVDEIQPAAADHVTDDAGQASTGFIFYTSGTTGKPKGVQVANSSLVHHCEAMVRHYAIRPGVFLQQAPLGFDLSLCQSSLSVVTGGTLVIASSAARRDPVLMAQLLLRRRVTHTVMTPTQALALIHHGHGHLSRCVGWEFSLLSGEALRAHVMSEFRRLGLPGLKVFNGYGPTEVTVNCTGSADELRTAPDTRDPTIGRTLPNYSCYVLDEQLQPVRVGLAGELFVGGAGVAEGYLGRRELSETKFLDDPFAQADDLRRGWSRMYRTGDKVKLLADGRLVFLGRIAGDAQVKLRGFRIELDDVASNIVKSSDGIISEAAVSLRQGDDGSADGAFLVAFAVVKYDSRREDTPRFLKQLLWDLSLPQYMVPANIVAVDGLPMNASGKLDQHALDLIPVPVSDTAKGESLTTTQQKLKELWLKVLPSVAPIGSDTDFFEVGGNSLRIVMLRDEIARAFDVSIAVFDLFQWSTLAGMAANLKTDSALEPSGQREAINWAEETCATDLPEPSSAMGEGAFETTDELEIVLTGATGFLGSAILKSLLEDKKVSHVHCVALRNAANALAQQPLLGSARVACYQGDLGERRLGLSQQDFDSLSQKAHRIIHNGADVSFLKSYHSLRGPNVQSTRELATLAARRRIPLHFVSSGGVASLAGLEGLPEISVSKCQPPTDGSQGYAASKWASEVFLEGCTHLFPVFIHRPSNVTGGSVPSTDLMGNLLEYSGRVHALPDMGLSWRGAFDFVPVEAVAEGISRSLHETRGPGSSVFRHHCADDKIPVHGLAAHLEAEIGAPLEMVSVDEWLSRAEEAGLDATASLLIRKMLGDKRGGVVPCLIKGA